MTYLGAYSEGMSNAPAVTSLVVSLAVPAGDFDRIARVTASSWLRSIADAIDDGALAGTLADRLTGASGTFALRKEG